MSEDVTLSQVTHNLAPQVLQQAQKDPALLASINEVLVEQKVVDARVKTGLGSSLTAALLEKLLPQLLPLAIHALIRQVGPQVLNLASKYVDKLEQFMTPEDFASLKHFLEMLDPSGSHPLISRLSKRPS